MFLGAGSLRGVRERFLEGAEAVEFEDVGPGGFETEGVGVVGVEAEDAEPVDAEAEGARLGSARSGGPSFGGWCVVYQRFSAAATRTPPCSLLTHSTVRIVGLMSPGPASALTYDNPTGNSSTSIESATMARVRYLERRLVLSSGRFVSFQFFKVSSSSDGTTSALFGPRCFPVLLSREAAVFPNGVGLNHHGSGR